MRVILQRVSNASVEIEGKLIASIFNGILVLVGFESGDNDADLEWTASKICNLRIFNDEHGVMNKSVLEQNYEILVVSQFTLHALVKKGNRPSYIRAAVPDISIPLYNAFCGLLQNKILRKVQQGIFGADMKVSLVNDGPVTIFIDSKSKE